MPCDHKIPVRRGNLAVIKPLVVGRHQLPLQSALERFLDHFEVAGAQGPVVEVPVGGVAGVGAGEGESEAEVLAVVEHLVVWLLGDCYD